MQIPSQFNIIISSGCGGGGNGGGGGGGNTTACHSRGDARSSWDYGT